MAGKMYNAGYAACYLIKGDDNALRSVSEKGYGCYSEEKTGLVVMGYQRARGIFHSLKKHRTGEFSMEKIS